MDKYETLRNQVVWAVTHYGIVNTEGIIERLRETVLELDSEQLQKTSSNSDYAKLSERLQSGRDYLMAVSPEEISVEKCLIAFGWDSNGFE